MKVVYCAAHGGFASEPAPLGGGAAVWRMLQREWDETLPFPVRHVTPAELGICSSGAEIVRFDTGSYARFCRRFERVATEEILRSGAGVALVNDIAEAPDFRALADAGVRMAAIWHVDVVHYISSIYCRGLVKPETLVRAHAVLESLCPDVVQLIFRKQADCVQYCDALIVPSPEMKRVILRCYPRAPAEKIHVVEWGTPRTEGIEGSRERGRAGLEIPEEALVLLLMSRISPEKNQELLLRTLIDWEERADFPARPIHLIVAGEAAFMQGMAYAAKLKRLARRLRKVHVHWPGYIQGEAKQDFLAASDLYVFPSRHESYGLTLMEAFGAGLPALTLDHAGARAVMRPEFGEMVGERDFGGALQRMLNDAARLAEIGLEARAFAEERPFSMAAKRVSEIVCGLGNGGLH